MIEYDINSAQPIDGEIAPVSEFTAEIAPVSKFTAEIGVGGVIRIQPEDLEIYDGDTTVTPKANEQTVLDTAHKIVEDDITVMEIPFYQTTNPQGGNTIYIGRESEVT